MDDIGSYYDRKRTEQHAAFIALQAHKEVCRECIPPDATHQVKWCRLRNQLFKAWIDAGNTGD